MAYLTTEQVKEIKDYLSNVPERVWVGKNGLTTTEVDLFDTIETQHKALIMAKDLFLHYHETYCGSAYCDEGCQIYDCKFKSIGAYLNNLK